VANGERRNRLADAITGKQPFSGMGALPIVPKHRQQFGRQHDIAVFMAFALINPDDHALAINRSGLKANGFGYPQAGRITHRQDHSVLQVVDGAQKAPDFVLAQNDRKLLRFTAGGNIILDNPRPLEGDGIEKSQGGDRDDDLTGRETPLLRQVDQICPDLGWPEMLRRSTKISSKPNELLDIHTLCMRGQVADLHIFDHATAKWAHGQLLCEMDSATWRRRIVSPLSCQARGGSRPLPPIEYLMLKKRG
jgi:hypothetical protein